MTHPILVDRIDENFRSDVANELDSHASCLHAGHAEDTGDLFLTISDLCSLKMCGSEKEINRKCDISAREMDATRGESRLDALFAVL